MIPVTSPVTPLSSNPNSLEKPKNYIIIKRLNGRACDAVPRRNQLVSVVSVHSQLIGSLFMSESRDPRLTAGHHSSNGHQEGGPPLRRAPARSLAASNGQDVSGWDTYRNWLTQVQAPEKRRVPLDPNLYTWKGYRNWSDQVRRGWKPEEE